MTGTSPLSTLVQAAADEFYLAQTSPNNIQLEESNEGRLLASVIRRLGKGLGALSYYFVQSGTRKSRYLTSSSGNSFRDWLFVTSW